MKQIPNLFTLLNLVFGTMAIVFILENGLSVQYLADGVQVIDIPERIWLGSLFIGLAALVDFLDGFVARLFNATSEMGKQLDSLADVVSFGVAPSLILYQLLRRSFAETEGGVDVSFFWLVPAFLFAAAAAYRLAKFNISTEQQYHFLGVPTPAAGLLIASFPLIYWYSADENLMTILLNKWFLYGIILFISWLMVSNIKLMSLKIRSRQMKDNLPQLLLLAIVIFVSIILSWMAVPVIFLAYILLSLFFIKKST
jgi:CDP-diacylglycerol--serine O-phosphatidyltransferase